MRARPCSRSFAWISAPVPTGTVDLTTTMWSSWTLARLATACQMRDRSASPEGVGGVSTQRKMNSPNA